MASRLSVSGPSRTLIPEQTGTFYQTHLSRVSASASVVFITGTSSSKFNFLICTCHFAAVGNSYCTDAVVGNGCDLTGTSRPMVIITADIWMRHWVWVIGVQVVTALWTLRGKKLTNNWKTIVASHSNKAALWNSTHSLCLLLNIKRISLITFSAFTLLVFCLILSSLVP